MTQAATIHTLTRFIAAVAALILLPTACGGGSGGAVMPDLVGVDFDQAEQELDDLTVNVSVRVVLKPSAQRGLRDAFGSQQSPAQLSPSAAKLREVPARSPWTNLCGESSRAATPGSGD